MFFSTIKCWDFLYCYDWKSWKHWRRHFYFSFPVFIIFYYYNIRIIPKIVVVDTQHFMYTLFLRCLFFNIYMRFIQYWCCTRTFFNLLFFSIVIVKQYKVVYLKALVICCLVKSQYDLYYIYIYIWRSRTRRSKYVHHSWAGRVCGHAHQITNVRARARWTLPRRPVFFGQPV